MEAPTTPTPAPSGATLPPGNGLPPAGDSGRPAPQPGDPHAYTSGCPCPKCAGQRAKWNAKKAIRIAAARAQTGGVAAPRGRPPISRVPTEPNPVAAPDNAPLPVPWTSDTLRPLFAELVPVLEDFALDSLKQSSAKVSGEAVALVSTKGRWNPVAKTTLVSSGAQVAAKWLNHFGISADNAPEIALSIAVLSIGYGHISIKRELEKMGAEETQRRKDAETQEKGNPA